MGNSMGKKRNMASAPSKKQKRESHSVSLTSSSSFNHLTVEFPKEIEEDLERRKIESFKALAEGSKKPKRTQSSSGAAGTAAPSSDPTRDLYEKMRSLDVPAVMVPKPWSEVDQILARHKDSFKSGHAPSAVAPLRATPKNSPLPEKPKPPAGVEALEEQPETVDMWELMDDLEDEGDTEDENDAHDDDETAKKSAVINSRQQLATSAKPDDFSAKNILALEKSLSFSTIHTIKEFENGAARPETVASFMRPKYQSGNSNLMKKSNSSSAITSSTPRKVNVNPNLLARIQAFE